MKNESIPQNKSMLVSDFDGTITKFDFYDLVCQQFPDISGGYWHQYESGALTHFEALRLIFAGIRAPEEALLDIIRRMEIEPRITDAVSRLKAQGWDVAVASAGCDWYIRRLLAEKKVTMAVYSNPGEYFPDKGLLMRLPEPSPFLSPELGVNKVAVVRDALNRYERVAFAGDGRPDLAPALLVDPKRRFAKAWLAKKLHEINEPFIAFERWSDVAEHLLKEGPLS
ncbi:MAG: MtnX-like HAD-IB family phosphatase [Candidatus Omnitrophica bacterium]|nr:MtnX-like HAD-IB family phosphatase [Candidatus Omnitrophota bacterium]